ncbi:MAG: thioredoxin family protein, partial [Halobacteriovoraceae bacterium]|nr:thioredoxin family protein [Halobacteriovoraceae bacterium]
IFYALGVLSTFLVLAIAVLGLKSTGENVGWGFQLQSPVFVALMILVLFVFALNLFGLYEFSTPGGKSLGNVELKKGMAGDFLGGVLATILSTPCSAPFLGTALTFAFTASTFEIILTFQAIGLGLAFPFILTGLFPGAIKFLPKPGMWMESVKKFLGLTLLLTAIWLLDVFVSLTSGNVPLMKLNTGLILVFFAIYYQKHISKKLHWRAIFYILALLPFLSLFSSPLSISSANTTGETDLIREKNHGGEIVWESWSEQKMDDFKSKGELVFIDFTAKWCFTCKVNEKLVLDTDGFRDLVKEKNIKLLLGDWTKYDPVIGAFLKKHGYVGVPAYFIQKPDGSLVKLGETITLSKIEKNL